jgi:hypothetical protein
MLTKKQKREHDQNLQRQERDALRALIEQQIVQRLGEADGPRQVQVRRLWDDHYRVNVLVGTPAMTSKVSNSYFVEADSDGHIVESNPEIARLSCVR